MIAKILLVIAFVAVAVAVGIYCRRHTGTVDGFILGGRNVGPWMSAFAYGTSYFSAVVFVGYAASSASSTASRPPGRHRQRHHRLAACLVGLRPPHPRDDPSPAGLHYAGVLRQAL